MSKLGPIGTKFISCFIDASLRKLDDHVKVKDYGIYLENSIQIGISWLYAHVFLKDLPTEDLSVSDEFRKKLLLHPLRDVAYNNLIMDCCYFWLSYVRCKKYKLSSKVGSYISQTSSSDESIIKWYPVHKYKEEVNVEANIVKHEFLLVEVSTGILQKFVYIQHDSHYDYLPLWYVLNKYPKLKYSLLIK